MRILRWVWHSIQHGELSFPLYYCSSYVRIRASIYYVSCESIDERRVGEWVVVVVVVVMVREERRAEGC